MRAIHKITVTAAAAAVLFGMSGLTSAAFAANNSPAVSSVVSAAGQPVIDQQGADHDPAAMSATAYHRQFTITNLSGHTLRLSGISTRITDILSGRQQTDRNNDQLPAVGTLVPPAGQITFQVAWEYAMDNDVFATFADTDTGRAVYQAHLQLHSEMFDATKNSWSTMYDASLTASNNGDQIYVYDAGAPVIDVPASNAQQQADVLASLCGNARATCAFTPTGQRQFVAEPRFATYYENPTSVEQEFTARFTHTSTRSSSLNVSASVTASIMEVVEVAVTAEYGQSLEVSDSRELTYPIRIPPHTRINILVGDPMVRTTGDFTVTMGNTTWRMTDVVFSTPAKAEFGPSITLDPVDLDPKQAAQRPQTLLVGHDKYGPAAPVTSTDVR